MAMGCSAKVQRLGAATAPSLPRLSQARALTNMLLAAPAPTARAAAAGGGPARMALRHRAAVAAALPRSRAARMELEECLSEAEDWVFNTACEGAACWQPDGMEAVPATIGARVELPPGLAHGTGSGALPHSTGTSNCNGKLAGSGNGSGAVRKRQDEGPMDQDALDAWRATMDIAQGDGGAGLPEEEQLRSRESLLLSVDGMVGNWELFAGGIITGSGSFSDEEQWAAVAPPAALPADPTSSGEYAALLAELQQLADTAGLTSRLTSTAGTASRAAAAAAPAAGAMHGTHMVGEGASVTDIE